jgi:hypothetical protein
MNITYYGNLSLPATIIAGSAINALPTSARALTGADLLSGAAVLGAPTLQQCACLTDVSVTYIVYADQVARHPDLRREVEAGHLPLLTAYKMVHPTIPSDEELINTIRGAGVERAWQALCSTL